MKKIFKSKRIIKFNIKHLLSLLLISFFCVFILNKINLFKDENTLNIISKVSINNINTKKLKINNKYLLNIGLSNFDNIKFKEKKIKKIEHNTELKDRVYIYNTHQTEEYRPLENYNLTPTVLTAAYILKDKLKELNIGAIVEESNMKEELQKNGYEYKDSYTVSRGWLENLNKNNLDLYIDLHRDSPEYKYSNITVDGKDYAKIMFVLATGHDYTENLKLVNRLLENIESINKDISRGIFKRGYIYNQDFNNNCVLIEVGGPDSPYESVANTLEVLALAIKNTIGEENGR